LINVKEVIEHVYYRREIEMKKKKLVAKTIFVLIGFVMVCMHIVACYKPHEPTHSAETTQNETESTENKDSICQTECSDSVFITETSEISENSEIPETSETSEYVTNEFPTEPRVLDYNRITPSDIAIYEIDVDIDLSLSSSVVPELIESELVYDIMGTSLTGTYGRTHSSPYYNGTGHYYGGITDSGVEFVIAINSETGNLHDFYYRSGLKNGYDVSVLEDLDKPILTESECQKIAEKFFYNEMNAKGNYHVTVEHRDIPEFANGLYEIKFVRTVDHIKTDEYVWFEITERGRIISVYTKALGSMDNIMIPDYDEEEVINAVEYKLSNMYQRFIQTHTVSYEIADRRLTRLQDGKLYLQYQLEITIFTSEGEPFAYDHAELLVCIN
jgi:hypothetical protein